MDTHTAEYLAYRRFPMNWAFCSIGENDTPHWSFAALTYSTPYKITENLEWSIYEVQSIRDLGDDVFKRPKTFPSTRGDWIDLIDAHISGTDAHGTPIRFEYFIFISICIFSYFF